MQTTNRYNTALRRIAASFIDGLCFLPFSFLDYFIFNILSLTKSSFALFIWITIQAIIYYGYSVWFHANFGQTLGKMALSIKVIDANEKRKINLKQALMRDSPYLIVGLSAYITATYQIFFTKTDEQTIIENIDSFGNSILFYWTIAELITMFLNKKKKSHSRYACTYRCSIRRGNSRLLIIHYLLLYICR